MMTGKRLFDVTLAVVLCLVLALPALLIAGWLLWSSGRPVLHRSERMKSPDQAFTLWKFRTMTIAPSDSGVSGGDKAARITPAGRILRRTRMDEIPQLWNVLRGDMSFVGPRPPLRDYVERFPQLYGQVLQSRPGITGLATLRMHQYEERLLAACTSAEDTDRVYVTRCIPRKARLDLIYAARASICLDIRILCQTAKAAVRRNGG